MIEVDRLVMYRCDDEYKLAIINKDETKVVLVVDNVITNFNAENLFTYKFMAGNEIDDEWESTSHSFRDFLFALARPDRKDVVYPEKDLLPDAKKFAKIKELIPCRGITLEREQLAKIEKYLNKIVFKKLIEKEKKNAKKYIEIEYINF